MAKDFSINAQCRNSAIILIQLFSKITPDYFQAIRKKCLTLQVDFCIIKL